MYCSKCGADLSENALFCVSCGEKVDFEDKVENPDVQIETSDGSKKTKKRIIIAIIILVVIVLLSVLAFGIFRYNEQAKKDALKEQLLRDWYRNETTEESYNKLELDFSEDKIYYNLEYTDKERGWLFGSFDYELCVFSYEIISANEIEITGSSSDFIGSGKVNFFNSVHKIEFNSDKTVMTITPALTNGDDSEEWSCI